MPALLALTVLLFVASVPPQTGRADLLQVAEAKDAYSKGNGLKDKRQYEKAIGEYNKAVELEPNYFAAYINRGLCYLALWKFEDAIADFNKAEEINPDHPFPPYNRGQTYRKQGKIDEAEAEFEKAIEKDANYAEAICMRALCWAEKERYDEAKSELTRAAKLDPKLPYPHINLGVLAVLKSEYKQSLVHFEQGIKLGPNEPLAYTGRAAAYLRLHEIDKAMADCEKALKLDSECVEALGNRGLCYLDKHEYAKAEKDFNKVLSLKPTDRGVLKNRAINYECWGKFKEALADYDTLIEGKADAQVHMERGQVRMKSGDPEGALADFDACVELDSKNPMFVYARGQALKVAGKLDEAIDAYTKAIKLGPTAWGIYTARADAYIRNKDLASARKDLTMAANILTQVEKQHPEISLVYDWTCYWSVSSSSHEGKNDAKTQRANDVKKALEYLKKTLEGKKAHEAHIRWDPEIDPLRSDPGYKALIKGK